MSRWNAFPCIGMSMWAGTGISDARKLAALEVITGRDFNSAYGSNPVAQTIRLRYMSGRKKADQLL